MTHQNQDRCPECGQCAEPARVTDVRFKVEEPGPFAPKSRVLFGFGSATRFYAGYWDPGFKASLHPLDIALIERCWAEGQRPACVPADVTEWTVIEGRAVWKASDKWVMVGTPTLHASISRDWVRYSQTGLDGTGSLDCPESLFRAARKWAGWDVTPSGEVKAPFGRTFPTKTELAEYARDADRWAAEEYPKYAAKIHRHMLPIDCPDCNGHGYTSPDSPCETCGGWSEEKKARRAAALSDHIRRGDTPSAYAREVMAEHAAPSNQALTEEQIRASIVDLTELREWCNDRNNMAALRAHLPKFAAAVERLVGK